jgi:hypothetical protein
MSPLIWVSSSDTNCFADSDVIQMLVHGVQQIEARKIPHLNCCVSDLKSIVSFRHRNTYIFLLLMMMMLGDLTTVGCLDAVVVVQQWRQVYPDNAIRPPR